MKTILVQISENHWTLQAVHLACSLARHDDAKIILLRLLPVYHPGYLGTEFVDSNPTPQEYKEIAAYHATAEDYGVSISFRQMQYVTALDAVVDAAEQINANVVFAHIPASRFYYWHKFLIWNLQRRLVAARRQLYTLDQPDEVEDQLTSIIVKPARNLSQRKVSSV
jgi:hypothetical protein